MSLFDELQRRKVIRVGIAYVIAAWVLAQVADLVAETFLAPVWVMQMIVTLLIVGLPISLILSWAFDLTLDGIVRTDDDPSDQRAVSSKHFYILIAGLVVAVAVTLFLTWPQEQQESIAVLPFEDLSPDGDQAYFGNGIADELRLELQRLDGLRVAGRMSSIAFAQDNKDGKTNGVTLNVDSILEGSIRKDGNRIRITAQLINTDDGFPIWSESYDRELANILEIQEEIATSVAGALGVRLGVGGVNEFRGAGTLSVEAYEAYLQSFDLRGAARISRLELATKLDPNYAAPWARMSISILSNVWSALPRDVPAILERATDMAHRAVELDDKSAAANSRLASVLYVGNDWIGGEESNATAIRLLADRSTISQYANMLMRAGRSAAARTQYDKAESIEPLGGRHATNRSYVSVAQRRFAEVADHMAWKDEGTTNWWNLQVALNEGDPEEIKATMRTIITTDSYTNPLYAPVLSAFDSPETVPSILRDIYADKSAQWPGKLDGIAILAAYFGDPEFALRVKAEEVRYHPARMGALWFPVMSEVRRLPEFKELVTELNLVAYWRTYGWADLCRPLGADDFECF